MQKKSKPFFKVAFQGERGAYSELAITCFFRKMTVSIPQPTFEKVFQSVKQNQCDFGIVPIENSLTGSIHENYDLLRSFSIPIVGEIKLRISHSLIALPGVKFHQIREAISHPQALLQCQEFLKKYNIKPIPAYDTAGAVKDLVHDQIFNRAAIASSQAAKVYQLPILKKGIESNPQNFTRFLLLGKKSITKASRPYKTSILFSTKNIAGVLYKSLSVFAMRDINLLKIESRPLHGSPWQYLFYLDFAGSVKDSVSRYALQHLKEISTHLKVLGSYPHGQEINPNS